MRGRLQIANFIYDVEIMDLQVEQTPSGGTWSGRIAKPLGTLRGIITPILTLEDGRTGEAHIADEKDHEFTFRGRLL